MNTVYGKTLPYAWEFALEECMRSGEEYYTDYDEKDTPPSRDIPICIEVGQPNGEPMFHKNFPGGFGDLEVYKYEVVYGIHDHWIGPNAWNYTYHDRLFKYPVNGYTSINQMYYVVTKLAESHHTRRAQAIIWSPLLDYDTEHPPCLQRIWFRLRPVGGCYHLDMDVHMRSNDAYKASFMNMYAFIGLQNWVIARLQDIGQIVFMGKYRHFVDSYHVYGADLEDAQRFLDKYFNGKDKYFKVKDSSEEEEILQKRTVNSSDVRYFLVDGLISAFNNEQQPDSPMPVDKLMKLYKDIPEDRRCELDEKQIKRMESEY